MILKVRKMTDNQIFNFFQQVISLAIALLFVSENGFVIRHK
jgi:hypothetical protein